MTAPARLPSVIVAVTLAAVALVAACGGDDAAAPGVDADGSSLPDAVAPPDSDVADVADDAEGEDAEGEDAPAPDVTADTTPSPDAHASACPRPPLAPASATVEGAGRYRSVAGIDPATLAARDITVFLPEGYDADAERRYPVLYMHDGQNLFSAEQAAFGVEWGVDETVELLLADDAIEPLIVVGIDNTADRIADYTPTVDSEYGGGDGAAYVAWLVETVKPAIDALFRTRCEAEHTGLMGSSLGGLISLYAALAQPGVFGRVGVVSPSLWWDGERLLGELEAYEGPMPTRLWLDMGTAEGESNGDLTINVARVRAARDRALARGLVLGEDLGYLEAVGGAHNEAAWRARLPAILRFLFGSEPLGEATAMTLGFFSSALDLDDRPRTSAIVGTRHGQHGRLTRPNAGVDFTVVGDAVAIDADGAVTAAEVGAARVTATVGSLSAHADLTVSSGALAWVTFSVAVPADTPADDTVHVSGDLAELGAWDADAVPLARDAATGRWRVGLALPRGAPFAYKYNRGTWETVEASSTGADIPNRTSAGASPGVRSDTVIRWLDR